MRATARVPTISRKNLRPYCSKQHGRSRIYRMALSEDLLTMQPPRLKPLLRLLPLLLFFFLHSSATEPPPAIERKSYNIPLANLSVSSDDAGHFEKVKISYGRDRNYAAIGRYDDMYVIYRRNGRERHKHRESFELAFRISEFEAEHLEEVSESFVDALKQFEKNLQKQRWGKCAYFDAFFPRFLKGFYFLYCAARNNPKALPRIAYLPDSLWESSLSSPLTDQRIHIWRTRDDYLVRLRIATKELIYQLEKWNKKELRNKKRNPDVSYGKDLEEAYAIFIKMYFHR